MHASRKAAKSAMKTATKDAKTDEAAKKPPVSILPALWRAFGSEFMLGALLNLAGVLLTFVSPQILKYVCMN